MIIENEFTVGAAIDSVWPELLDMEGVASCLPGATIRATDEENVYDGSMRLKIGPMRVEYHGTATLSEIDEAAHTAVISLSAREAKGQGSAMATIHNRLEPADGGTRVSARTELHITGPQAQFGRGVIEDVGKRVLSEFSQRLEQRITGSADDAAGTGTAGAPASASGGTDAGETPIGPRVGTTATVAPPSASVEPAATRAPVADELDVGALLSQTPAVRIGAGIVLAVLVLILLRRRR